MTDATPTTPEQEQPEQANPEAAQAEAATPAPAAAGALPPLPEEAVLMKEGTMRFVPKERELEQAPKLLRQAAVVLVVGSLLPWVGHGGGPVTYAGAKVLTILAGVCFYASVFTRLEQPVPFGLAALGKKRWGKPYNHKTKGFKESLAQAIPTPLHVFAGLVAIVGLLMPLGDPVYATSEVVGGGAIKGISEVGLLAMGVLTIVHIFAYSKGGSFNPIYPFLFLGALMMGIGRLATAASTTEQGAPRLLAYGGALLTTIAGAWATWTIVVSMIEAKKQGDAKKAAVMEARKAARAARRS
ncbi:MAG: hypothetical protein ACYS26_16430 [Planctomycetota bacterium]|jgi:hypothetical protein